jgi:tetratricopeptide (TPR) repeat protein
VSAAQEAGDSEPVRPRAAPQPTSSGNERVVTLNEEGTALYAAGDYRRAVERFLQAFTVDEDPNLLFNIASCYEELGDADAAIEKYRAFLDAPGADADGRPRAERAIERLSTKTAVAAEPTPLPAPPAPPPAGVITAASARVSATPHEPLQHALAWLPWVGLGGGAALVALGSTFYLMGASDHQEVTSGRGFGDPNAVASMTRTRADELVRSGNTKKLVGATTTAVGGVLAAGYLVWWLLDPRAAPSTVGSIDVAVNGSGTSLELAGRF